MRSEIGFMIKQPFSDASENGFINLLGGINLPIVIPKDLPASKILNEEKIFVMNENMAMHQDIRPLKIAIVNLMPTKIETETQLLRLIGNTPLQVDVDFINTQSHKAKNISEEHLINFYKSFEE